MNLENTLWMGGILPGMTEINILNSFRFYKDGNNLVVEAKTVLEDIRESFEQPSSDGSFFRILLEHCITASSIYNKLLTNVDKFYTSLNNKIQDQNNTFANDKNLAQQENEIKGNVNAVYNEYNKNLKVLLLLLRTIPNIGD